MWTKELIKDQRRTKAAVNPGLTQGNRVDIIEDYKYSGVHTLREGPESPLLPGAPQLLRTFSVVASSFLGV